jgi:hypothetical protein
LTLFYLYKTSFELKIYWKEGRKERKEKKEGKARHYPFFFENLWDFEFALG